MGKKLTKKEIENFIKEIDNDSALIYLEDLLTQGYDVEKLVEKINKKRICYQEEQMRFYNMSKYERDGYSKGLRFIAGIDEAGRGPLAGPVVAAAVILPENIFIEDLNDSKQLTSNQRDRIYDEIKEKAIAYGVGIVDEKIIDEVNILNATKRAMVEAINSLKPQPDFLLIDAVKLEEINIALLPIIKGDSLSISIAAASIIAKVTRDRMIEEADSLYPVYGFSKHKGYGTKEHIDAIKKFGLCPIHRISFTKNIVQF